MTVPGAVPLFDGLNFPDEPYRYVMPPPGYHKTPPPDRAKGDSPVSAGTNAATIYVNTDEVAPQVNVVIFKGQLAVPSGTRSITVTALPEAPDRQPSKGKIDGNLYRITAAATPSGTASWAPPPGDAASLSQVVLRASSAARPAPVFLHRSAPTSAWNVLPTGPIGNDIYRTQFAGFGDYALAFGVVAVAPASHLATYLLVAVPLLVVLLAVVAVLLVRTRRRAS